MSPSAESLSRIAVGRRALFLGVLLALALGHGLLGAAPAAAEGNAKARAVLEKLEDRYEVLELSRGYALKSRQERAFRLIEVAGGRVFVDGKETESEDLEVLLGDDAGSVLELARATKRDSAERPAEAPASEAVEREKAERNVEQPEAAVQVEVPAPESPVSRRGRHGEVDVSLGSSRTVESGEELPGLVLIGGFLDVEKGGTIWSDTTVVGGAAEVGGEVHGSLVVIGGGIKLEEGALIDGDVVSVGGSISEEGGARIEGQKVEVAFGDLGGLGPIFDDGWSWGSDEQVGDLLWGFSILELLFTFFGFGVLMVVIFAVVLIAPGRVASIAGEVRQQPWRSGLIGLLTQVAFLPILALVVVVLLVSVIGIPLLLVVPPLLVIALIIFSVVGYAGVAQATGGIIERRFDRRYSVYGLVLWGILLIEGWSLLGEILLLLPGPIKVMALLTLAFGFFVQYVAWTVGLGAAISDEARRRQQSGLAEAGQESGLVDNLNA